MQTYREMAALQHAAEFDLVSRDVRITGIAAALFGALALLLGVMPPADPLVIGIGGMLALVGLWNLTNPQPLGIALGGIALVFVGLYNIVGTVLAASAGVGSAGVWPVIGFWQIVWGAQAFARYRRFANAFAVHPDPARRREARAMVDALRKANPKTSNDVLQFTGGVFPPVAGRIRLADDGVLFLLLNGDDIRALSREEFSLEATGKPSMGSVTVRMRAGDRTLKAQIPHRQWPRYEAWRMRVPYVEQAAPLRKAA
jgi:hypothetical protein